MTAAPLPRHAGDHRNPSPARVPGAAGTTQALRRGLIFPLGKLRSRGGMSGSGSLLSAWSWNRTTPWTAGHDGGPSGPGRAATCSANRSITSTSIHRVRSARPSQLNNGVPAGSWPPADGTAWTVNNACRAAMRGREDCCVHRKGRADRDVLRGALLFRPWVRGRVTGLARPGP